MIQNLENSCFCSNLFCAEELSEALVVKVLLVPDLAALRGPQLDGVGGQYDPGHAEAQPDNHAHHQHYDDVGVMGYHAAPLLQNVPGAVLGLLGQLFKVGQLVVLHRGLVAVPVLLFLARARVVDVLLT